LYKSNKVQLFCVVSALNGAVSNQLFIHM